MGAQSTRKKPMSKTLYRIHLIGMFARVFRSFLFNVVVFFAGVSIGMGFTVLHVQKIWQDSDEVKAFTLLRKSLRHHHIHDKAVDECLMQMKKSCTNDNFAVEKD